MRPGLQEMTSTVIKHLHGYPVARADILAADTIYGPNLGSLKGKTSFMTVLPACHHIDHLSDQIVCIAHNVHISMDILFVNNIPFLLTKSKGIHYGAINFLSLSQLDVVAKILKQIVCQYCSRGLTVLVIHADPEFKALEDVFTMLETVDQDDHIFDIERFV